MMQGFPTVEIITSKETERNRWREGERSDEDE